MSGKHVPSSNPTIVEAVEKGENFANREQDLFFADIELENIASYITGDVIATKSTGKTHSVEILTELHGLELEELGKILEKDRDNAFNKKD